MANDPLAHVLATLATFQQRGVELRAQVALERFDAWKEEVRVWLQHTVSTEEAQKFGLLIDTSLGRGLPAFYDWMVGARVMFLTGLHHQLASHVLSLPEPPSPVTLFISHSSSDEALAAALVEFLRSCINIPDGAIRCTSVAGYKLETGASAAATLRAELRTARCAVGLISRSSVQAAWVLFELGARWGRGLHVAPVLLPDAEFSMLPGPLRETHAVGLDNDSGMLQLVEELSEQVGYAKRSSTGYPGALARLSAAIKATSVAATKPTTARRVAGAQPGRPTPRDIRRLLVDESVRPSEGAGLLAGLGPLAVVLAEVLQVQEDHLRDLPTPTAIDRLLEDQAYGRADPHEHMERVVARLCERDAEGSRSLLVAAGRRAVEWRHAKGQVVDWHFQTLMRVLAAEIREIFGRADGDVARAVLDGYDGDGDLRSALSALVVNDAPNRDGRGKPARRR